MKIPVISSRTIVLALLSALPTGQVVAQSTGTPTVSSPTETPTVLSIPVPGPPTTPTVSSATTTLPASTPTTASTSGAQTAAAGSTPWIYSLFDQRLPIQFGVQANESYSDNIFFQPTKTNDYITEISPFLVLTLGNKIALEQQLQQETIDDYTGSANLDFLQVSYHPTIRLFARDSFLNIVDEFADALYAHQFTKLTVALEQNYQKLSQPTIQDSAAGTLVHRDIFTTTARANYAYSDQLSTYGTVTQIVSHYLTNGHTDSNSWEGDGYFLYALFPKMSLGFGPRIGWVDVAKAPNQVYQAGLVHLAYAVTDKVNLAASAGLEVREFQDHSTTNKITPVFDAAATYEPFDSTTLTLVGSRHSVVSNSQIGQNYTATAFSVAVRQRLLQVIYLTVSGGFENDEYDALGSGASAARDDDFYFLYSGLEWKSNKGGLEFNAGYQYTRDESTFNFFSFNENRFTLSATLTY